ncbi:MAG TPA: hypothetical protein VF550_04815, partial [Polyangia bacterium]
MTFARRIATRSSMWRTFPALLFITACAGIAGCAGDDSRAPPAVVGTADNATTARLTIDEAGISGQVTAGVMHLQIPVS